MAEEEKPNLTLILVVIALLVIAWLIWTGYIVYVFALIIIAVVGYVVIKTYGAKEEEQPVSPQPTPSPPPTVIKEREIIKEVVMIPCQYCRSLMPQTSTFCPNCGAKRKA